MKRMETPVPPPGPRQLNLSFDAGGKAALDAAVLALAQILMQAAGSATEKFAPDDLLRRMAVVYVGQLTQS